MPPQPGHDLRTLRHPHWDARSGIRWVSWDGGQKSGVMLAFFVACWAVDIPDLALQFSDLALDRGN